MTITTTRARLTALALASLTTVVLAGCGAQSLGAEPDAADTGAVDLSAVEFAAVPEDERARDVIESVEPQQDLHEALPEEYRTAGLRWTTSGGYPPMELYGENGSDLIGVDPAMAHAVSRALGVPMTIEDQEFNAMIPGLMSNRFDALISSMTDNEERRQTTTFIDYVSSGNAFLVAEGNPLQIETPMDLCGHSLAMVEGGSSAVLAQELSAECEAAGQEPYTILTFSGDQDANLALESGRADATVTDYPVAVTRAEDPANAMEAVVIEGDESVWGIGVDNADPELAAAIQAAVQHLMDEGHYASILAAWGVDDMAIDRATLNGE